MIEVIQQVLATWNSRTNDRQKLQQTYVAGAVSLLLAAGLVSLVNYQAGQSMLLIALIAFGMFVVNGVVWALLQSFLLRLPAETDTDTDTDTRSTTTKKTATKRASSATKPRRKTTATRSS